MIFNWLTFFQYILYCDFTRQIKNTDYIPVDLLNPIILSPNLQQLRDLKIKHEAIKFCHLKMKTKSRVEYRCADVSALFKTRILKRISARKNLIISFFPLLIWFMETRTLIANAS